MIDHTVVYGGADPSGGALSSGRFRSAVSPLYAGGGGGGGGGGGARSGRFQPADASPEPRSELADGLVAEEGEEGEEDDTDDDEVGERSEDMMGDHL